LEGLNKPGPFLKIIPGNKNLEINSTYYPKFQKPVWGKLVGDLGFIPKTLLKYPV